MSSIALFHCLGKFFREINAYKKSSDVLLDGSFKEIYRGRWVYVFERELDGRRLTAVCNFAPKRVRMPVELKGAVAVSNYGGGAGKWLRPYEFVLLENV